MESSRGILCDELRILSRSAIGPPPNVTQASPARDLSYESPPLSIVLEFTATQDVTPHHRPSRCICRSLLAKETNTREGVGIQVDVGDHSTLPTSKVCSVRARSRFLSGRLHTAARTYPESNLVDSASSHTLVSKIKPCMSKYKRLYTVKLRTAH